MSNRGGGNRFSRRMARLVVERPRPGSVICVSTVDSMSSRGSATDRRELFSQLLKIKFQIGDGLVTLAAVFGESFGNDSFELSGHLLARLMRQRRRILIDY